ncbi:DinB family protein [uncultured Psychroserpens sp.]|uniref:DinB family protein n=1 Tax=uncultured Psychroserpens sp. TaxID=255436 RepID=UPI00262FB959|nr:DinB family protein [uncultured Psychroserpens sp.]
MIPFNLEESIDILKRTPEILSVMLNGLPERWLKSNEGENTWSPYDIVGHYIYGEKTDWIVRTKIILSTSENKQFEPFDRFAQFDEDQNTPISELIAEFKILREKNLNILKSFELTNNDLIKKGIHPELGDVTLQELLSAWVVHDLAHLAQINRVMAKQYKTHVGVWQAYMSILSQ